MTDGTVFRDMSIMGVGACVPGYADPVIDLAVLEAVRAGMVRYARSGGEAMSVTVRIAGLPIAIGEMDCLAHFQLGHEQGTARITQCTQRMPERNFIAFSQFEPSLAHTPEAVGDDLDACGEIFDELARVMNDDDPARRLPGPAARQGFHRLT